ncbi:hypothetical protein GCM10007389_06750 [Pontibacter akesuensis]|nr:hypothetical protein GCM10007389_06750 [Pontibacter akesuensis]
MALLYILSDNKPNLYITPLNRVKTRIRATVTGSDCPNIRVERKSHDDITPTPITSTSNSGISMEELSSVGLDLVFS